MTSISDSHVSTDLSALPAPLIPPGVKLPGIDRTNNRPISLSLRGEFARGDAEAFLASIELYCAAFEQNPAGSLPACNESLEALLTEFTRAANWAAIGDRVRAGWVSCSDGRLYRQDLAISVLTVWLEMALKPASVVAAADRHRLIKPVVEALVRLRPESEILDRVAAATGIGSPPDWDAEPKTYDVLSAVFADELADIGSRENR